VVVEFHRQTGKLDSTSLKALKEMLPTAEEKGGLLAYMKKCGSSEEAKDKAYSEFSECEKYMYTMLDVSDAAAKFDCMLFRSQFTVRYHELLESIETIENACDEVRTSQKLQTIMAMILILVNEINTGGDGNEAAGFTLDALLKLNEVRVTLLSRSSMSYGVLVPC
jgi:Formin Homology 2 Domain